MAVIDPGLPLPPPSPHALALAGADLLGAPPPQLRVLPAQEVVVVLPRSRLLQREVFLEQCLRDGVPVVVRPSGGGAVVLSPGVVTVSCVASRPHLGLAPEPHLARFGAVAATALAACGVTQVTFRGVFDLCLGERKVAGSALRLWGHRVMYQLAVLVSPEVALMERYLPMPSRQPAYRRGRPHAEFVTTLRQAGFPLTVEAVAAALQNAFAAYLFP